MFINEFQMKVSIRFIHTILILSLLSLVFKPFKLLAQSSAQLAPTPPMGWNSYNSWGATATEADIKANADYVATNLKQAGWQYIVVDYCWWYPHPPGSVQNNPPQYKLPNDGSLVPYFLMDKYGRLQPDTRRFPSSKDGEGMKPLADYVHAKGLKFGIHVMRGIPRQAYWYNTPVKGTEAILAKNIADTTQICGWLNTMWGVDMNKTGAQEYYDSLLELYASWGVDFIKLDDMQPLDPDNYHALELEAFKKAIIKTKRPIVLSISPKIDIKHQDHVRKYAEMFRVSEDFWDTWDQVNEQFKLLADFSKYTEKGKYPDGDMLQLGKLSNRGPNGEPRFTRLNKDEQITHMTLWTIARSPLIFGGNLPENDTFTNSLLNNLEVIKVNQKATNAREVYSQPNGNTVWLSENADKTINVAVFNRSNTEKSIEIKFDDLGLDPSKKYKLRNLWLKKNVGVFENSYSQSVNAHGAAIFKISTN